MRWIVIFVVLLEAMVAFRQISWSTTRRNNIFHLKLSKQEDSNEDISKLLKLSDEERLQKVISRAGIASRRAAEKLILDGRVLVNGKIITELGTKVKPKKDIIQVDGKKIVLPDMKSTFWVIVNKPKSILTTAIDDKDRDTILSLVPRAKELRLLPVGRMERDATGLMILTNENGWLHPLTHPSFAIPKRYEVVIEGLPTDEDLDCLSKGPILEGEETSLPPCKVEVIDFDRTTGLSLIDITLKESRPRQLQRMMELIKCPMVSMKRIEFGPIQVKGLRRGQWRELSLTEIQKLKDCCIQTKPEKKPVVSRPQKSPANAFEHRHRSRA